MRDDSRQWAVKRIDGKQTQTWLASFHVSPANSQKSITKFSQKQRKKNLLLKEMNHMKNFIMEEKRYDCINTIFNPRCLCPSFRLTVSLLVRLFFRLSVHIFVLFSVCPSLYPYDWLSVALSFRRSAYIHVFACPSVFLSVRLFVRPSLCLSEYGDPLKQASFRNPKKLGKRLRWAFSWRREMRSWMGRT